MVKFIILSIMNLFFFVFIMNLVNFFWCKYLNVVMKKNSNGLIFKRELELFLGILRFLRKFILICNFFFRIRVRNFFIFNFLLSLIKERKYNCGVWWKIREE